ncbi:MAG: hypothetical protein RW306_06995 [Geobacteraceae bacterium]|nr:hypothetical protein [Geobacteraceae bacterium]
MEERSIAYEKIKREITEDISEVRDRFLAEFNKEIDQFSIDMTDVLLDWQSLDTKIGSDAKLAHVSALVYSAITLQILSMKLLISGQIIAAGNIMRQVLETIATALLCSSAALGVLEKYFRGKYSTQKSVEHLIKHASKLGLKKDALKILKSSQIFYHGYSHPTLITIATHISFDKEGALYVGSSFDEGKVGQYRKEIEGRLSLSKVFSNFVLAVTSNLGQIESHNTPLDPIS